jgi:hypothetical protein
MQIHERAPAGLYPIVNQGEEDAEFWAAFNNPQRQHYGGSLYNHVTEWSHLYIDVSSELSLPS